MSADKPPVPQALGGIPMDLVVTFLVANPEEAADLVAAIDPPNLPRFNGQLRVVVGNDVLDLHEWLDEKPPPPPSLRQVKP